MSGIDIDRIHGEAKPPVHGHRRRHTDAEQAAAVAELEPLSPKQREVLVLALKGFSLKETARRMDIHHHTVTAHRTAIVQVLGMSLIEAAVLGVRAGWV